ncbi:MAG: caspase family protein [Scytonema sp. PMC 1069.18]|nr:caspase family protein [Scytonema sp. PMC 1069.18]MEC4886540.1 caspase family protein [Scytonema sp. PMC 1070.18]
MADQTNQTPNFYALLMGIDCYSPNQLPDGSPIKNLRGCVRDINYVEAFLKETWKIPENHILKLTSSANASNPSEPLEPPEQLPTYKNIVDKFRQLTAMASKGDLVYIHYSGHGGYAKTSYPKIKGANGIDETLIPTDIGKPEGQHLRDLELAKLLQEMVDKELVVTLVLDSCHSGGATRGDESDVRGIGVVDTTPRSEASLVASSEELTKTWESLNDGDTRSFTSGRLPESRDYVVLAACRQTELAHEYVINKQTKEFHGALTYWLIDSLRQLTPELTYRDLQDRIIAKVNSLFPQQMPLLIGEGNRVVFSSDYTNMHYTVPVRQVNYDMNPPQIYLEAGQVTGLRKGAEFAIYKLGSREFTPENCLALAIIKNLGATESWCELQPLSGKEAVQQGDRAVLTSASTNLVRKIRLLHLEEAHSEEEKAFQNIKDVLGIGKGWIKLADDENQDNQIDAADYIITVNKEGEYEICDRTGTPFPNLRPPLKISDSNSATQLIKRLVHLAKYHATEALDNFDRSNPLMGKLVVEWMGWLEEDEHDFADEIPSKDRLRLLDDSKNPTVKEGDWIFLRIHNNFSRDLNFAVLGLGANWAIQQAYPPGEGNKFDTIGSGQSVPVAFQITLPEGYEKGADIAKVFATVGSPNFTWLALPPLDEPLAPKSLSRGGDPLEDFLAAIDDESPTSRPLNSVTCPSREWTTKQLKVNVKKA